QAHGVEVLPIDINLSDWDCTLERDEERGARDDEQSVLPSPPGVPGGEGRNTCLAPLTPRPIPLIRLGFRLIKGFAEAHAVTIVAARKEGPFRSVADFARRGRVSKALLARLAAADAFRSLGLDRRAALWKVLATGEDLPLFAGLD